MQFVRSKCSVRYIMVEFVGKGQFGRTYKVCYEADDSIWLAKSIDLGALDEKEKLLSLQEAAVMQTLRHPGIVGWRESFVHRDMFLVIIMVSVWLPFSLNRKKRCFSQHSSIAIWNAFLLSHNRNIANKATFW